MSDDHGMPSHDDFEKLSVKWKRLFPRVETCGYAVDIEPYQLTRKERALEVVRKAERIAAADKAAKLERSQARVCANCRWNKLGVCNQPIVMLDNFEKTKKPTTQLVDRARSEAGLCGPEYMLFEKKMISLIRRINNWVNANEGLAASIMATISILLLLTPWIEDYFK